MYFDIGFVPAGFVTIILGSSGRKYCNVLASQFVSEFPNIITQSRLRLVGLTAIDDQVGVIVQDAFL